MIRLVWGWMLKVMESFFDVARHGEVNCPGHVIPVQFDSTVQIAIPVKGNGVVEFDGLDEMLCMFCSYVFDPKIINDEG
jgi:hypothetical protein